jgi:hypothetical protein
MGLQTIPAYVGGLSHPVELDRRILRAQYRKTGMTYVGAFNMTTVPGSMALNVGAGTAYLNGIETAQQGGYFVWSDAAENIPWPAASGQPRIDLLVLRVVDLQYGSDPGTSRAMWEVIQGTPAASPTAPNVSVLNFGNPNYRPGAVYVRATVRVDAGDTDLVGNTITALNEYSASSQYDWTVPAYSNLAQLPPAVGDRAYVTGTDRRYEYLASGVWYPVGERTTLKTADTLRASTVVPFTDIGVNDIEANTNWHVEANIFYKTGPSKIKFSFAFPAGAEMRWGTQMLDPGVTLFYGNMTSRAYTPAASSADSFTPGGDTSGGNPGFFTMKGVLLNAANVGSLFIVHQPETSNAATVGMLRGSTLRLTPFKP